LESTINIAAALDHLRKQEVEGFGQAWGYRHYIRGIYFLELVEKKVIDWYDARHDCVSKMMFLFASLSRYLWHSGSGDVHYDGMECSINRLIPLRTFMSMRSAQ
jgi:deoxyribodipyrimidine photolyase-like uncharacterized protein